VLDECNDVIDYSIARHIINTHRGKSRATQTDFTKGDLQTYIRFARTLKPQVSEAARQRMVEMYVELRGNDASGAHKQSYRITVRHRHNLLSLSPSL
jgi:DNA replication licensing factor MCM6